jgi:hypothetical protein
VRTSRPSLSSDEHKQAEIESHERALREARPETFRKPFRKPWESDWIKWATITAALRRLGVKLIRLAAANVAFAPRASIWFAARRVER